MRVVGLVVAVVVLAVPNVASAHTYPSNHHGCPSLPIHHGIKVDSTNWGHSSSSTSSIWPTGDYDRITNHYFRSTSTSPWYYIDYDRATCW
jgi:Zn-dependent M28 family amino/carboxypeptidase